MSRSLFYGPTDIVGESMVVRGTTVEAFSSLIRFIYDDPDYMFPTDDRQKLFEMHEMAEKYQVTRLVEEVDEMLIKLPIKVENASKVENLSEDIVDYEMNIKDENMSGANISHFDLLDSKST